MINSKGFTLIEILVVTAVIGIMSAVVTASLGNARTKAADNAIKAELISAANQAEIYYGINNSYGTFAQATCPTSAGGGSNMFQNDSRMLGILNNGVRVGGNGSSCVSTAESYAMAIGLKTSGQSLCIDNTKIIKEFTGTPAAAITSGRCN